MGKIQCVYDMNNNFFFHLMSVSKIGYDNDYGKKYANTVEEKDIATLKKYEKELTMKGGEYDGKLFWTGMYAGNASKAIEQIKNGQGFPGFESYTTALLEIFEIFQKYHDDYCKNIWPQEEKKLSKIVLEWQKNFDEEKLEEKAEKLTGIKLDTIFYATLITSIANGVEAILYDGGDGNIYDLFGIDRDYKSARFMFLHEYIITLLQKQILFSIEDYYRIEGLAEYYCEELIGKSYNFTNMNKYINFYRAKMAEKSYSPKELFEASKGF